MTTLKKKIVAIIGPTATGKSDLAVKLAKKHNGEVVSADSRQVYKDLDIGTGKITKKEMCGIPHHLLDVASPKKTYTVADYKQDAIKATGDIISRGKTPILCGGTGFYIDAVLYDMDFPDVAPNKKLRLGLGRKTLAELQMILKKLDKERYASVDIQNPRRIIRAIEIATEIGKVPKVKKKSVYRVEYVYVDFPDDVLKKRIHDRLIARMKKGMVREVKKLHEQGLSWKRMEELGLEYRYVSRFVRGLLSKDEMLSQLEREIWHYAKRQRTWFKKTLKKS